MAELLIRDEALALRLLTISTRENRPVEALLADMMEKYEARATENPILRLARSAEVLGLTAARDDIAENFDDYLRASYRERLANQEGMSNEGTA